MSRIAQSAASVQLAPSNDRIGFIVHNDSAAELRIKFGLGVTAVSLVDYNVAIPAGMLYESPFGVNAADGAVFGIWTIAGSGAAQFTEYETQSSYASLEELKSSLRIIDNADDTLIQLALDAATEAIDGHCDRTFSATGVASTRSYDPVRGRVEVDDIYTATDLVVMQNGIAIPLEVEGVSSGYRLEPYNAPAYREPYTSIAYNATVLTWPSLFGFSQRRVYVTAQWGYAASVPTAVKNACLIQASRLFSRRNSPYGIAGSPELGSELRLLAKVDPDVAVMLSRYVRMEVQ